MSVAFGFILASLATTRAGLSAHRAAELITYRWADRAGPDTAGLAIRTAALGLRLASALLSFAAILTSIVMALIAVAAACRGRFAP